MAAPAFSHLFIDADGVLAESLCHAELLRLTSARAEVLYALHRDHPREECSVVTAAELHLP